MHLTELQSTKVERTKSNMYQLLHFLKIPLEKAKLFLHKCKRRLNTKVSMLPGQRMQRLFPGEVMRSSHL